MVSPVAWIALFGYIPVIGLMFAFMRPYRAVMAAFLVGWLFLPEVSFRVVGLPNLDKYVAISTGVLLWMTVLDSGVFARYRFHPVDLVILLWSICPLFSSVENGYGVYDGLSGIYEQVMYWTLPYFIGRLYFTDLDRLRELAFAVVIGALVYIPLIFFELRMSPQLHKIVYGFHPSQFQHALREGGYRPIGFMRTGLTLALFIAQALVLAVVLWRARAVKHFAWMPIWVWIVVLAGVLVLCKSKGALILALAGIAGYLLVSYTRWRWLFMVAILAIPAFLYLRIGMEYNGEELVALAAEYLDPNRAASLQTRLDSEELLRERALEKPWFGWGGFGENRVYDDYGTDITITDSMWILVLGIYGLVGMFAVFTALLWPMWRTAWLVPGRLWTDRFAGPVIGVCIAVWIFVCDRLLNAQPNVAALLMLGALVGLPWRKIVPMLDARRRAQRAAPETERESETARRPVPTPAVSRDRPALN